GRIVGRDDERPLVLHAVQRLDLELVLTADDARLEREVDLPHSGGLADLLFGDLRTARTDQLDIHSGTGVLARQRPRRHVPHPHPDRLPWFVQRLVCLNVNAAADLALKVAVDPGLYHIGGGDSGEARRGGRGLFGRQRRQIGLGSGRAFVRGGVALRRFRRG